jgi:predicted O-linked N-acetylglucosamine transferase (SPINDLY family)
MTALTLQQAFDLALRHHAAGDLVQADSILRQILTHTPQEPQVLHLLGLIAYQRGTLPAAIELATQAISNDCATAVYHNTLGVALLAAGQIEPAIASLANAVRLEPDFAEAHNNLGNAYHAKKQDADAIASYRNAIRASPRLAPAHVNLGNALRGTGAIDDAINEYRAAIDLDPRLAEAQLNLGVALFTLDRAGEAIVALRAAVAINPALPAAHFNLGVALKQLGQTDDAIASYRTALGLEPRYPDALSNLGSALFEQGFIEQAIDAFRRAIAIDPDAMVAHSNLCYTMHFDPRYDCREILREHRNWAARFAEPLKPACGSHANDRDPDRRIRIGYLSPDFHQHPVARFLLPLLKHHDHDQFEVFGYSDCRRPDVFTRRIHERMDHWRQTRPMDDAKIAQLVRDDQIDILIDLSAHMRDHRLLVFARRPAPVQATYLAYCSTTGLDAIAYRISDPHLDPPGEDESVYTEQTLRLPACYWCYESPPDAPQVGPPPADSKGCITFGCLNNFAKVSAPAIDAFCNILRLVPDSRLVLHVYPGSQRQRPINALRAAGIDPSRLRFMPLAPLDQFLAMHHQIDIALDSFPYNGGTTSCDAMWMGVPLITLRGRTAVGRAGCTLLHNIGLPELIAGSEQDYVKIAVSLAQDRQRLAQLRASLRERMRGSPLMDAPRFAQDFERIYRQMWLARCRGRSV